MSEIPFLTEESGSASADLEYGNADDVKSDVPFIAHASEQHQMVTSFDSGQELQETAQRLTDEHGVLELVSFGSTNLNVDGEDGEFIEIDVTFVTQVFNLAEFLYELSVEVGGARSIVITFTDDHVVARADELPETMRFDPGPQKLDWSASGGGVVTMVQAGLAISRPESEEVESIIPINYLIPGSF